MDAFGDAPAAGRRFSSRQGWAVGGYGEIGRRWWTWRRRCAGPAVEAVYATGTVEPVRWAAVAPAQKARLREVLVDDGDRVSAGQVLAHLDDTVTQAQVAEAEARARFAPGEAERLRIGWRRVGHGAQRGGTGRAARRTRWRPRPRPLRRRLDDFDLKAPIDGVVLRRDGEPGEMVDTADTVFWIGEPRPLAHHRRRRRGGRAARAARAEGAAARRRLSRPGARRPAGVDHAQGRPDPEDLSGPHRAARRQRR